MQVTYASLKALFRIVLTAVDDVVGNPFEVRCRIGGFHLRHSLAHAIVTEHAVFGKVRHRVRSVIGIVVGPSQ